MVIQITSFYLADIFISAHMEIAKLSDAVSRFKSTENYPINQNILTDANFSPAQVLAG